MSCLCLEVVATVPWIFFPFLLLRKILKNTLLGSPSEGNLVLKILNGTEISKKMLTFFKNFYADYVELFLKWQTNRLKNHMDSEEEEKEFSYY